MKNPALIFAAVTALAFPLAGHATAPPNAASASCKAQLKASGSANFDAIYKTMGACVSKMSELTATQRQALLSAEKTCRASQTSDPTGFESKYGTATKSGRTGSQEDAFGKCVSSTSAGK